MENFDYFENWSVVARQLFGLSNEWKVYRIAYCDKGDGYLEPTVEAETLQKIVVTTRETTIGFVRIVC